jgi:hypothetical protein
MHTEKIKILIKSFYPFAKTKLGFDKPVKVVYITNDVKNAEDPLGKTAYYNPDNQTITLFTLHRHPKDILRSFAHELTHHTQYCRGDFDNLDGVRDEGYAQSDPHLRKMEEEAYMMGGMIPRDFTDMLKKKDNKVLIMIVENTDKEHKEVEKTRKTLQDNEEVNDMFDDRRNRLNKKLMDKFIKTVKKEGNKE